MLHNQPGIVECHVSPSDMHDLCCIYDNRLVALERALGILDDLRPLPEPAANAEKVADIYKKVAKYIPEEHRDDPLYKPPTAVQLAQVQKKKKTRAVVAKRVKPGNSTKGGCSKVQRVAKDNNTDSEKKKAVV